MLYILVGTCLVLCKVCMPDDHPYSNHSALEDLIMVAEGITTDDKGHLEQHFHGQRRRCG